MDSKIQVLVTVVTPARRLVHGGGGGYAGEYEGTMIGSDDVWGRQIYGDAEWPELWQGTAPTGTVKVGEMITFRDDLPGCVITVVRS